PCVPPPPTHPPFPYPTLFRSATLAASAVVNIGILPTESPQLVAAAAITVLLSGLGTVSAVQDAITGYNVSAAGRTLEVAMMSVGDRKSTRLNSSHVSISYAVF